LRLSGAQSEGRSQQQVGRLESWAHCDLVFLLFQPDPFIEHFGQV